MKVKMFNSSTISFAKRDGNELTIRFLSGSIYKYENVPEEVIDGLWSAESAGRYFYKNIRGEYVNSKVMESAF